MPNRAHMLNAGDIPIPANEILRYAQNDRKRKAQNDRKRRAQNDSRVAKRPQLG